MTSPTMVAPNMITVGTDPSCQLLNVKNTAVPSLFCTPFNPFGSYTWMIRADAPVLSASQVRSAGPNAHAAESNRR